MSKGRFEKGHIPWTKGKKGYINSGSFQKGHKSGMTNKRHNLETKKKMSLIHKGKPSLLKGKNHWNWKNGLMEDKEYVIWLKNKRNRVIKRLQIDGQSHTFGEWETLKAQYGFTCPCCKRSEPEIKLTEDHIIPLSKGGSDLIENIQPLCQGCNCKKMTKIIKYKL